MATFWEIRQRMLDEAIEGVGLTPNTPEANNWLEANYQVKWDIDEDARIEVEEAENDLISKYASVANIYSKADRILSNQDVKVVISPANSDMESVATNNGLDIKMNPKLLDDVNDVSLVAINGLNYHELSHLLYSPRAGSELGKWVMSTEVEEVQEGWDTRKRPTYQLAFNTLEEARIESLMATKYPSTRYFLEASATTYAIDTNNPESLPEAFYITRGRLHLDIALRQRVAELYVDRYGIEQAQAVADIIDEYRTLAFPRDSARAKELIMEMQKYVGSQAPKNNGGCGCADRPVMKNGRTTKGSEQNELQDQSKQEAGDQEQLRPSDKKPNSNDPADNYDSGDEPSDGVVGDDEQTITKEQRELSDEVTALINERAKYLASLPEVKADTKTVSKALNNDGFGNTLAKDTIFSYSNEIKPEYRYASKAFGDQLERLRVDNDPEWEKERPSGKLNIPRTMNSGINDLPRLFDKWSTGNDNCDIEAVIMLDRSGSMAWDIANASGAVWAMKRGLERIDSNVTVMSFNHISRMLYDATEKAEPNTYKISRTSGGTNPSVGLRTTQRLMRASQKPTKLLFIVTDGAWDKARECNNIVSQLQEEGVTVCIVYLGNLNTFEGYENRKQKLDEQLLEYGHGADHFTAISKPADLVNVARKVVADQLTTTH